MNDANDVMTSIYDSLLQLRYPHITKVESKDVEAIILNSENRVCLLSWLLTEKSPFVGALLRKLKDAALEDRLFEYYSQIGICNNKNLLLGKCSLKEQLPVLRLLLDFMRKMYVEPLANTNETEENGLMDIIKLYISDVEQASSFSIVKPKLNYTEATKYFEENEKETLNNDCVDVKDNLSEDLRIKIDDKPADRRKDIFDKEKEKFIETFQTISSWPTQPRNLDKATTDLICSDIKSICSDFSTLKKVLQAKDEILNVNLAKSLPKTTTPLNAIIEDIVIYNEKLENLSMTNSID